MKRLLCATAMVGTALIISGCTTYYQVREPAGGRAYYTTDLEDTRAGAVKFKDGKSGATITLQNSEVQEIPKDQYERGLASPVAPGIPK